MQDGNIWWYRITLLPWSNNFYASADAFWNNGTTSGKFPRIEPGRFQDTHLLRR